MEKIKSNHTNSPKLEDFDFVRFTWADFHGVARGKAVPRRNARHVAENGIGIVNGIMSMPSAACEPCMELPGMLDQGFPNVSVRPDLTTLHPVPWAGGMHKHSVGEVLCETQHTQDGSPHKVCPRFMARRQLEALAELQGCGLYAGFECEMLVTEAKTGRPLWEDRGFCSQLLLARFEGLLFEVDDLLSMAGVNVESYQTEYNYGQPEFPLMAEHGIKSADSAFILRHGFKEICYQRDLKVTYMTKPTVGMCSNGFHFNHSLCALDGLQGNVFQASSEKPTELSERCQRWLAGLVRHAPALCALACPTVNCYRRMHAPFAPDRADWGMDNRLTAFRVKSAHDSPPYIENRIPSSCCNPYLVLAATVAAGIDGLTDDSLHCPPERDPEATLLPHTLEEALTALEQDSVMVSALGEDFIKQYVPLKRKTELVALQSSDVKVDDQEAINKELAFYGDFI